MKNKKNLGFGPVIKQRVWTFLEALIDYTKPELRASRIPNLTVKWLDNNQLHVTGTLDRLRQLYDLKYQPKQAENTADEQKKRKRQLNDVLTYYLKGHLGILEDRREGETSNEKNQGLGNWDFVLHLWGKSRGENQHAFERVWEEKRPAKSPKQQRLNVTIEGQISIDVQGDNVAPTAPEEAKTAGQASRVDNKRAIGLEAIPAVPVWVGRDDLVEKLKEKLLAADTTLKVLALIGQGGIGKTSLSVKLLEALGVNLQPPALTERCIYDIALYFKAQEGSSFDGVAEFLLRGLGMETAEPLQQTEEKIAKILEGLTKARCLLVLDNLEVILHPASHPQAGQATSPDWGKLLNQLAYSNHRSRVIITSREVPADLADARVEDSEPDPDLVCVETVTGIEDKDGVLLLQQRQLQDSEEDLRWVSERVEGHVFLLTQLASLARGKPGYLRKHPELVTKKAEPILQEQLARQSEAARDLLRRMCVLRVAIDIRGLTFLRLYTDDQEEYGRFWVASEIEEPAELTDEEIEETQAIVQRVVDSSLVQCRYDEQQCEIFYDLHRLIVEYLQAQCQDELPQLLETVYKFYCTGKNVENPKTLEDLRPVLEAQYFAFQLGNYSEASILVMGTLEEYLRRWGHWTLLKKLYEQISPHVDEDDRPICLRQIGRIHRDMGNWDEGERYFQEALAIEQEENDKSGIAYSLAELGYIENCRGNWDKAERLYRQSLQLRTELGDRSGMASTWASLGDIENCRGNWDEAERLYRQSLQLRTELGDRSGMAATIGCLGENELGRGNLDAAEPLLREALAKMEELGMAWHIAETNYDFAQLERRRGNTELAEQHFTTARQIFQQLGAAKDLERIDREWGQD